MDGIYDPYRPAVPQATTTTTQRTTWFARLRDFMRPDPHPQLPIKAAASLLAQALPVAAPAPVFHVTHAVYGNDTETWKDVTAIVVGQVTNGRLEMTASNAELGGDPAPNVAKMLRIDYLLDGVARLAWFNEDQAVILP